MQLACHYYNSKPYFAYGLKTMFNCRKLVLNGNTSQDIKLFYLMASLGNAKYHCKLAVVFSVIGNKATRSRVLL